MDLRTQLIFAMALVFAPVVVDLAASLLRRSARYRFNDLVTNLTLSLLTIVGGALAAGLTVWVYARVQQSSAPFALSAAALSTWLLAFLAYDFLYYWAHRVHHHVSLLWGVHVVHHSGEDMNFGLAVRQSALGGLTSWYFFLPMALVGIPAEVYLGVSGLQLLYQYFIHNTYVPPLGWLEKLLVTPSQHRVHHARNQLYIDKNYGNILVVWDRLFGTYQAEVPEHRVAYGLRHGVKTWNPLTLHTHGFVEIVRKAAACRRPLDKLRCFVRGPSWVPPSLAAERFTRPDDGPSTAFVRYNPPMPRSRAVYCAAQFLALTAFVVLAMWHMDAMPAGTVALVVGLMGVSAWSLGGLLDGKPFFWRVELARVAAIAVLGLAAVMGMTGGLTGGWTGGSTGGVTAGLSLPRAVLPFLLLAGASVLYLLRFRVGFGVGAPAAQTRGAAVAG